MTVRAIYEHGVFRPSGPVDLPEKSEVELEAKIVRPSEPQIREQHEQAQKKIFDILSRRYNTGQTDAAERHNEHQP